MLTGGADGEGSAQTDGDANTSPTTTAKRPSGDSPMPRIILLPQSRKASNAAASSVSSMFLSSTLSGSASSLVSPARSVTQATSGIVAVVVVGMSGSLFPHAAAKSIVIAQIERRRMVVLLTSRPA